MKSNKLYLVLAAHFVGLAVALIILNQILPLSITKYYFFAANVLLFLILSWYSLSVTKQLFLEDRIDPEGKAVLITGCDSGFGHNLAKRLDSKGFNVFATCIFPSGRGAEELRKSCTARLKILEVDVTKDESVSKAVEFVERKLESSELWAIVNNAGISKGLTVAFTDIKEFKECMEVNVYGGIRILKAFLPFLKKSKGRVINITSIFGRVSIPHFSPYTVSKHAAVGLSDLLRQELIDWGISVISVEPELFRTGLTDRRTTNKMSKVTFGQMNETQLLDYDVEFQKNFRKSQYYFLGLASGNIEAVIDDLESAISLVHPDAVYSPRRNAFVRLILYIFVASPIPMRDFLVKLLCIICRYKGPQSQ